MSTATAERTTVEWLGQPEALEILACGTRALRHLVESGQLTVREVPGSRRKYLRSEVTALAAASTRPARREVTAQKEKPVSLAGQPA